MRKIIACLDIGSFSIKLVVGEITKNKVNILACAESPSQGIKKGYIVNPESASIAIKDVFSKCENMLGLPIKVYFFVYLLITLNVLFLVLQLILQMKIML